MVNQPAVKAKTKTIYVCPGAETCGIKGCQHYLPHEKLPGCDNGCFGKTRCVIRGAK